MLKFFRKYNKVLLAVFMTLLMIVFVGGTALQNLFTPQTNLVVAESLLGPIETSDRRRATATTRVLDAWGLPWETPFGPGHEPLNIMDWVLLVREAERFQARASVPAVKAWLGGSEEVVDTMSRRLRVKPGLIYEALAEMRSVQIVAEAMTGVSAPSTAEVRRAARDALDRVKVNAVVLPAALFVDETAEFSDERLEAQLEAHRDAKPEAGMNFGYYVEPSLTVQYVKIDRNAIAERIRIPDLERKAKRYFDENREGDPAFRRPPEKTPVPDADPDHPPEAEGEQGEAESPFLSWEQAKDAAMDAVRTQRAAEAAEQIANWMRIYDDEQWADVDRGEDRYKPAPEAVVNLEYYDKTIRKIPVTIAYPEAVTVATSGEFFRDNAGDVEGIGSATYRPRRGASRSFATMAFRSQPIVPTIPDGAGGRDIDYLSLYRTCPFPLGDQDGNIYVFRVAGSTPGHAAESPAEVRDRVVDDLRLTDGYELAKSWAETLRFDEDAEGLEEAYSSDGELADLVAENKGSGGGFFTSAPVARVNRDLLAMGLNTGQTYVGGGIGMVPSDMVDRWFALEDTVEHMAVYELPDRARVLVVEWVETERARFDEFEQMRGQLAQELATERQRTVVADWFDPEQIRARNGFELATR